jgi:hypothetical protein
MSDRISTERYILNLKADVNRLTAENSRLVEIIQEAYEADHSGSFQDWLDMNGYRLAADADGLGDDIGSSLTPEELDENSLAPEKQQEN